MENSYQTIIKRHPKVLPGFLITGLIILIMSFIAYDKTATEESDKELEENHKLTNSISFTNGTYAIDSVIAMANWNRDKLLTELEQETLVDKKTTSDIPGFICHFLDNISVNNNFDIANSGEDWEDGGWVKGFDKDTKNISKATAYIARPFPSKQLIYFGIGKNMAILSYYTGGIRMAQHVILMKFEKERIVNAWFDNGSYGCNTGNTGKKKDNIIKFVKKMDNNRC